MTFMSDILSSQYFQVPIEQPSYSPVTGTEARLDYANLLYKEDRMVKAPYDTCAHHLMLLYDTNSRPIRQSM